MKNRMAKFVLFITMTMFLFGVALKSVNAEISAMPKEEPTIPIELDQ
ncbi:MAG: hypothetical protein AB7U79_02985 [Candidatus Izemoplasmatales bacterium]